MALSALLKVIINATQTKTADFESASSAIETSVSQSFADGVGADQADLIFKDTRTLAASAAESLDLAGSLTDIYGATVTFARVKAIYVKAAAGNTNDVQVTRPASNGLPIFLAAGDGIPVRPDGVLLWMAPDATGIAVTAGTGDLLTLTNSAGSTSVTYDIVIIGASA